MDALPFGEEDFNTTPIAPNDPSSFENHNILLHSHLEKRYTTVSIPSTYGHLNSGPAPGTVAGIVLGTVGGVVIILYLTFLALNPGGMARGSSRSEIDEEVVVRSRRTPSRRRSDMIEVVEEPDYRRRPSYRRPGSRGDRIIVEESTTGTETTDSRDVVEVIEEESSAVSTVPPRRGGSHRSGRGYRTVDPREYGGGGSSYGGSHY
ncbi:hypothetical protein N7462_005796 [Penicillium macrosclerotiorum]|uniref:uncharacterized protein n=1 Tax=Penicillium macrosclerotiorum TaxID=303699 RepID=UPI002547073B|nr:uncharacterized protein N7462_005796 [Penicillium macrosclerotiorum]KAJ5682631.1 hypothetical protein N7462_005796 [Penicillium macrosclerotiorum]